MSINKICIKILPNGNMILENVTFFNDGYWLNIDRAIFNCSTCGKKSRGIGSSSTSLGTETYSFCAYDHNIHIDGDNGKCPKEINMYNDYFFGCYSFTGGDTYKYYGPIYLVKYDSTIPRISHPVEWFNVEHSLDEILLNENILDCTEADIDQIKNKLNQFLCKPKKNGYCNII